jgi:hypothetical protein
LGQSFDKGELVCGNPTYAFELSRHDRRQVLHLLALLVLERQLSLHFGEAGDGKRKVTKVNATAVFTVGDGLKPNPFLQSDSVFDPPIFLCVQLFRRDFSFVKGSTCRQQLRWTQQATDMFCTEWGGCSGRHTVPLHFV